MKNQVFAYNEEKMCFDLDNIREIKCDIPNYCNKPNSGGLWTSSLKADSSSAWLDWCMAENFGIWTKAVIFVPKENIKVYVIDSFADLDRISKQLNGMPFRSIVFKELKNAGYHGIHLTENGARELHFLPPCANSTLLDLNAWDCESSFWFNIGWIKNFEIRPIVEGKIK